LRTVPTCIGLATPALLIHDIIAYLDLVLVMSVNPGFGGQEFIPSVIPKAKKIRQMLDDGGLQAYLQIDGGINQQTGRQAKEAGCNVLVAGSYIFNSEDVEKAVKSLKQIECS